MFPTVIYFHLFIHFSNNVLYFLADDLSVLSSLTTISNGSNTPSIVGETLGSISLSDHAHKKGNDICTGKIY
jgi:hypothetical protein